MIKNGLNPNSARSPPFESMASPIGPAGTEGQPTAKTKDTLSFSSAFADLNVGVRVATAVSRRGVPVPFVSAEAHVRVCHCPRCLRLMMAARLCFGLAATTSDRSPVPAAVQLGGTAWVRREHRHYSAGSKGAELEP
jgi:hypothetical protein